MNESDTPRSRVILDHIKIYVEADNAPQSYAHYEEVNREIENMERELTAAREENAILKSKYAQHHAEAERLTSEMRLVTEQRDDLLRYNEAFRKETLICADCDAIRKEEYDQAIEQRDRLQKIVDEQCRVSSVCREYREQRDRAWQTIAEIKRDIMEDETFGDVVIKLWQEPLDEAIEQRDRLAERLRESNLQLQYLDEKYPSGTTPTCMTRNDEALQSLTTNAKSPSTGATE
jgi:chromosome segregation ATPase